MKENILDVKLCPHFHLTPLISYCQITNHICHNCINHEDDYLGNIIKNKLCKEGNKNEET